MAVVLHFSYWTQSLKYFALVYNLALLKCLLSLLLIKVNGTHTSVDMPPKIPFFTGLKANCSQPLAGTASHSATTGSLGTDPAPTSTTQQNQQGKVDYVCWSDLINIVQGICQCQYNSHVFITDVTVTNKVGNVSYEEGRE